MEVFMNSKFIRKGIAITSLMIATVVPVQSIIATEAFRPAGIVEETKTDASKNSLINVSAGIQKQKNSEKSFQILSSKEIAFNQRLLNYIFVMTENNEALVYAEPKDESDWIGKVYQDSSVNVVEMESEWTLIQSGNVTGYVKTENLILGNEAIEHTKNILNVVYAGVEILDLSDEEIREAFSNGETREEEEARLAIEAEERRIAEENARRQKREDVVAYAKRFIGNPYVYGGTSLTNGTDCSGFVRGVYQHFGISLPRTSYAMRSVGYRVSVSEMQPGDIVCYNGHVGIYAGNGKLVDAVNSSKGICLSNAFRDPIITVRRIF